MLNLNRRNKFYLFIAAILSFLIFEICVLCRVEYNKEQRLEFVRRFNIINFSFYPNEPYFRHFFSYFGDEIYNTHPGFREDEKGSFINLGYQKRLKNR